MSGPVASVLVTRSPSGLPGDVTCGLYERIIDYVLDEIRRGALVPGDRVSSEMELAEQFEVSRITSKRALELLRQAGVVERIRGKGSFVAGRAARPRPARDPGPGSHGRARGTGRAGSRRDRADLSRRVGGVRSRTARRRGGARDRVHGGWRPRRRPDRLPRPRRVLQRPPAADHPRRLPACAGRPLSGGHPGLRRPHRQRGGRPHPHGPPARSGAPAHRVRLAPPENTSSIEERLEGFRTALARRGLPLSHQHLLTGLSSTLPGAFSAENVRADVERVRAFQEREPEVTAFVVCEYNLARVMDRAVAAPPGRARPLIACFDSAGDPVAGPAFLHVRQDQREMGRRAVDLLLAQTRGEPVPSRSIVPFTIVEAHDQREPR
ncbi:GntR family transcriptional regulator [Nonomuraea sp. KM88]|uniref:GntR family transcriptional regulator n=1 Tax=Nonomuraea sp. KM88 TaxID=3457427 RepID=UPI003FCC678E